VYCTMNIIVWEYEWITRLNFSDTIVSWTSPIPLSLCGRKKLFQTFGLPCKGLSQAASLNRLGVKKSCTSTLVG